MEEVPEDFLSWSHVFAFEKTFFKVSVQNCFHRFKWYHWLRKFSRIFQNYGTCVICTGVNFVWRWWLIPPPTPHPPTGVIFFCMLSGTGVRFLFPVELHFFQLVLQFFFSTGVLAFALALHFFGTGVTVFALVLHLNFTALSQSESST